MGDIVGDIERLREEINSIREGAGGALPEAAQARGAGGKATQLRSRRVLRGHFGKIYAMQWSADSQHLVSASQDGKLIVWNGYTTNKLHAVPLRSSWVMTCAYHPSGNHVACGGLDNVCSVYNLPADRASSAAARAPALQELVGHEGYLSSCRFIGDTRILTSSGDGTCMLWDFSRREALQTFASHTSDVMSVAVLSENTFVSGSCDATCMTWDARSGERTGVFTGHESDVNTVATFPDGNAFGSGSDDSTSRFFDLRSMVSLAVYEDPKLLSGITSVAFSGSGKYIISAYDSSSTIVWDTVRATSVQALAGHENRVSCLGMSPDGKALCTGSWDTSLMIWA